MNHLLVGIAGTLLILLILMDGFETIILPRRVARKFRLARIFYILTWFPWKSLSPLFPAGKRRETYLSYYGPLSLIFLLVVWAAGLVLGFGLLYWSAGSALVMTTGTPGFWTDIYLSGTTFFTLGIGDVTPRTSLAKWFTVCEAGMGFAFLAMMLGYLPVIYQGFSRREVSISLLDAHAGSPPTAAEMLRRHAGPHGVESLRELLQHWERTSAEILESHLSYPVLAYFRSQHINQSWLSALTTILDVCAFQIAALEGACERQAELTFAMARHVVVDLAQVFSSPPSRPLSDRLPPEDLKQLRSVLKEAGFRLREGPAVDERLRELRFMYEPYSGALSARFLLPLAPWLATGKHKDNWQASGWDRVLRAQREEFLGHAEEDHF